MTTEENYSTQSEQLAESYKRRTVRRSYHHHHHQHDESSSSIRSAGASSETMASLSRRAKAESTATAATKFSTGPVSKSSSAEVANDDQTEGGSHFEASASHSASASSSVFVRSSSNISDQKTDNNQLVASSFLNAPSSLFTSPDVRNLVQEIGTDFAELENALSSTSSLTLQSGSLAHHSSSFTSAGHNQQRSLGVSSLSSRLFGTPHTLKTIRRPVSPTSRHIIFENSSTSIREIEPSIGQQATGSSASSQLPLSLNGAKIRELLDKAQKHTPSTGGDKRTISISNSSTVPSIEYLNKPYNPTNNVEDSNVSNQRLVNKTNEGVELHESHCKAAMNESIERIDQKMSDLCKKLEQCQTTDEAIDLLKIMIQMVEKAWSVPVCGDDLGFKLCNSLRHTNGLDIILGFIDEADDSLLTQSDDSSDIESGAGLSVSRNFNNSYDSSEGQTIVEDSSYAKDISNDNNSKQKLALARMGKAPLRLSLAKLNQNQKQQQINTGDEIKTTNGLIKVINNGSQSAPSIKDNDSDIPTSDLGLDSTSAESLSYVSAAQTPSHATDGEHVENSSQSTITEPAATQEGIDVGAAKGVLSEDRKNEQPCSLDSVTDFSERLDEQFESKNQVVACSEKQSIPNENQQEREKELQKLRKEELVFLSARLLSQCLTSENRDYIVKLDLEPIIRLACNYITMKSGQSKRLLSRSSLILVKRSSSTLNDTELGDRNQAEGNEKVVRAIIGDEATTSCNKSNKIDDKQLSDIHSVIGTEILQHLFKHSEETCSTMISLGGLQAILYGCRSSSVDTLRHCASALANLALYGGSDVQQTMIEQKAHVWLFPLAFNEDDNVQYYACLAIVVLAANQEIETDVLKSGTLELVEPFVTTHEPRKFAESTTSHIHGQSAGWLRKLVPLLASRREEARNLACFHFAMEAHIKREQGQTQVFRDIEAIEPLRRAGSSPIAIASKFACQALRLIGEPEPHKLSQQVPLWTGKDVCEWVSQIGFERFKPAFSDSHVDGDLLLQLDEELLKKDIGIDNGIIRRRFLRELANLKRIADYSSVDRTGLINLLASTIGGSCSNSIANGTTTGGSSTSVSSNHYHLSNSASLARDFMQYLYPILQMGVTRDNIHLVDCDQLLAACNITNAIHRMKLSQSIRELQERILIDLTSTENDSRCGTEHQKTLDCFVSYRRSTGSQLASLLKVHLQLRGFSVFIDVERLEAGKFDNNLLDSIKSARNFILVLSQNALDRCIDDHECKDWVHKEIVAALSSGCNIIPIMDNFQWPDAEQLPEDMRSIPSFNSVRWIHDYQDACVDKLERFVRGDWPPMSGGQQTANSITSGLGLQTSLQRLNGGGGGGGGPNSVTSVSTPSIVATTPSASFNNNTQQQLPIRPTHPSESDNHPLSYVTNSYQHHHNQQSQQQQSHAKHKYGVCNCHH